jgi:polyisoprenoid-binding protein YceI
MQSSLFSGVLLASSLALLSAGCDNDPARGKVAAQVGSAQAAAAQPAGGVPHAFDSASSTLTFVGAKITRKHDGAFGAFHGVVRLVDGDPTKSSVTADIDTASVSTDSGRLTTHLKTPDFFDVERFPHAKFSSTSIAVGGANGASHTITGNLELHGVTRSISFPATIRVAGDTVETDAEFAINRKDFGIAYPGAPDDLVKDEVLIQLKIRAKKS